MKTCHCPICDGPPVVLGQLGNLLTGKKSTKQRKDFLHRMAKITKAEACEIQAVYSQTGNKLKARAKAVEITRSEKQEELPLEQPKKNTDEVLLILNRMTDNLESISGLLEQFQQGFFELKKRIVG